MLVCSAVRKPERRSAAEITSRQQHAICATTSPARKWRIHVDGPALSRRSTLAGSSCRISSNGPSPHSTVIPTQAADAAAMPARSGANTNCSASWSKKNAGTSSVVHNASSTPTRTAGDRDDDTVGQELHRESSVAGAERDANGSLVRTSRGARQQQRGDIGAGDEKHGGGSGREQPADAQHAGRHLRRHARVGQHSDHVRTAPIRVHDGVCAIG